MGGGGGGRRTDDERGMGGRSQTFDLSPMAIHNYNRCTYIVSQSTYCTYIHTCIGTHTYVHTYTYVHACEL